MCEFLSGLVTIAKKPKVLCLDLIGCDLKGIEIPTKFKNKVIK